jgi:hypothetical protein
MIREVCPLRPSRTFPPSETLTLLDELLRDPKPIFDHAGLQRGTLRPLRLTPISLEPSPREMRSGGHGQPQLADVACIFLLWSANRAPRRPDLRVWPLKLSFREVPEMVCYRKTGQWAWPRSSTALRWLGAMCDYGDPTEDVRSERAEDVEKRTCRMARKTLQPTLVVSFFPSSMDLGL